MDTIEKRIYEVMETQALQTSTNCSSIQATIYVIKRNRDFSEEDTKILEELRKASEHLEIAYETLKQVTNR